MEIVGKLYQKGEAIQRARNFLVRDIVVEVENQRNPQWNDLVRFQVTNDRCSILDTLNVGELIHVTFEIHGRKWVNPQGREIFFNTLAAWKVERYAPGCTQQQPIMQANYGYPQNQDYVPGMQQQYNRPQQYQPQPTVQSAARPTPPTQTDLPF